MRGTPRPRGGPPLRAPEQPRPPRSGPLMTLRAASSLAARRPAARLGREEAARRLRRWRNWAAPRGRRVVCHCCCQAGTENRGREGWPACTRCARTCVCLCARACVYAPKYAHMCTCLCARVCVHMCAHACVHACVRVCVHAQVCVCMHLTLHRWPCPVTLSHALAVHTGRATALPDDRNARKTPPVPGLPQTSPPQGEGPGEAASARTAGTEGRPLTPGRSVTPAAGSGGALDRNAVHTTEQAGKGGSTACRQD